nr:Ty3/gypsy retrotransposon protein [Ipomoea batatas]
MSDSPTNQISMQGMQQMIEELMATQEARLQSQWKDQLLTFMAAKEAKWQAGADKGKAPARTEAGAETSLAKRDDNGDLTTNRDKEGGLTDEVLMAMKPSSKRLDVPKFDGADPQCWIFNIQEYFNFHQTPELQRLQIVGFCLEGDASERFRWMKQNRMLYGWHDFLEKVEQRFGTMQFEDPLADLAKLTQTGTMGDFQAIFEKLLNKVPSKTTIPAFSNSTRPTGNIVQGLLPAPKITQPSTTNTTLPIRKFSAPEIREWRDKGLCFHYDERYSPGHRCKGRFLQLIGDEDEDHLEGETINKEDNNLEDDDGSGQSAFLAHRGENKKTPMPSVD